MTTDIVFETQGHIGLVTLSRPQALNALNLSMINLLQQQLLQWQTDNNVHAVVVQALPGKAFCAGGDVRWLYDMGRSNTSDNKALQMSFFQHEYRLNYFIHQFNKPYIALMNGITMGGGVGISLHGSHPVASNGFSFAMPETGIGLFPDIGASYLLSRCPHHLGLYLALTGNRINAKQALLAGLVKYVVKSDNLPQILSKLQTLDLSQNREAQITACLQANLIAKEERIDTLFTTELMKINHYFSLDSVKAIMSALKTSDDPWAINNFNNLSKKSPLSLAITFAQIEKAKSLSLANCLAMDYCLVGHFMAGKDFYEGIRSALIDKDGTPYWQPSNLDNITTADVANYFE